LPSFIPQLRSPNNRSLPVVFISDFIKVGMNQWNLNALNSVFDEASVVEILKIHISLDT
jgi:hypothetical protein